MHSEIRVLHVDDDPEFARVAAHFLEDADDRFVVETATRASEALDRLEGGDVDCIVSDHDMPGQDGIEFLEAVRERHPDLPFVLFTGKGSEEVASEAISAGVTDYLQKRTDVEQYALLANRVANAVEAAAARREVTWHRTVLRNMNEGAYVLDADHVFRFVKFRLPGWLDDDDGVDWTGRHVSILADDGILSAEEVRAIEDGADRVLAGTTDEVRIDLRPSVPVDTRYLELRLSSVSGAAGSDLVVGTTRDVTAHKDRERRFERHTEHLTELYRAANRLYVAESVEDCYDVTIDAAVDILGFDWCTLSAPAEDGTWFEIVAISEGAPLDVGDRPFKLDEGLAGDVFQTGRPTIVDDVFEDARGKPTDDAIRSALTVPVGDWGVFQAVTTEVASFDERDRTNAELLVTAMVTAVDRLRQQERLERQNERLEAFAHFLSHDLKSPLMVAEGRVEMARADREDDDLAAAARALDRMGAMIDDLLTLARRGETVEDVEPVDLAGAAAEAWGTVRTADATLEVPTDARIVADRSRLKELLENCFRNAVEHGAEDVTVTVGPLEGGFYVADDGPGIPTAERDQVFERGYSTKDGGTGLGLTIVRQIVDGHGWTIEATASEDGGARFEVTDVDAAD